MGILRKMVSEEKEPMPEAGKSCLRQTSLDSVSRKTTIQVLPATIQAGKRPVFALASFAAAGKSFRGQISRSLECPFCCRKDAF
jgi:hypothetical protein